MGNGATKEVMQLNPIKLLPRDHNLLVDEINRRQMLDQVEEIKEESDDDANGEDISDEDEEGEEEESDDD
jgi:hypothetical protein